MTRMLARTATLALLVLAACADDQLGGLNPELVAGRATVADATGAAQYLVDFGEVPIGGDGIKTFSVRNSGRADLTLDPPALEAPFSSELVSSQVVPMQEEFGVVFRFSPTAEGPAEKIVTLTSDGGTLNIRLTGRGRIPAPTDCTFSFAPARLDFGLGAIGQAKSLDLRIVNTGQNPCTLRQLKLVAGSDPAFAIVGGAVAEHVMGAFDDFVVKVSFTAVAGQTSYNGSLTFGIGPPEVGQSVPLVAKAQAPTPPATEKIYVNTSTTLYSWDPSTASARSVGLFRLSSGLPVGSMTDIAIDSNSTLWGCDTDNKLYTINPSSGASTYRFKMNLAATDSAKGLTFVRKADGVEELIVASSKGVWAVDLATGRTTRTIASGSFETSGDIVGLPDGKLYWVVMGTSGVDELVRLDPSSGSTQVVGTLQTGNVYGVSFANGELIAFNSRGQALVVDPQLGTQLRTVSLGATLSWWGAATNPVTW